MPDKWWAAALIGIIGTAVGGIAVVGYQQFTTPAPGLHASGQFVTFAPAPGEQEHPTRIGPTAGYWHLTVRNNGNKRASDIRLRFPPARTVQYQRVEAAGAGQYFQYLDLGALGPGDEAQVSGWTDVAIVPNLDQFSVSHAEGYGTVNIDVVGVETKTSSDFFFLILTTLLGVISAVAVMTLAARVSRLSKDVETKSIDIYEEMRREQEELEEKLRRLSSHPDSLE